MKRLRFYETRREYEAALKEYIEVANLLHATVDTVLSLLKHAEGDPGKLKRLIETLREPCEKFSKL